MSSCWNPVSSPFGNLENWKFGHASLCLPPTPHVTPNNFSVSLQNMEHLWAPWRNQYVANPQDKAGGDVFAEIARSSDDETNHVLARGKSCFAVLNKFPYATGHVMIVPYQAVTSLEELSDDETLEIMTMLKRMKAALTAAFQPHGFNVGINLGAAAGAGIECHLHVHLVPRWRNDANFMTTTAQTRVHPSDLATTYAQVMKQL